MERVMRGRKPSSETRVRVCFRLKEETWVTLSEKATEKTATLGKAKLSLGNSSLEPVENQISYERLHGRVGLAAIPGPGS